MLGEHLKRAYTLSSAAHWPHRVEDWQTLLSIGHGRVAMEGPRVIGTTIWWPFGTGFATVGMIIVDQSFRGKGIGRTLVEQAMAEASPRKIGLVATVDGLPLYKKLGFMETGIICKHQASSVPAVPIAPQLSEAQIFDADPNDLANIITLDALATGADRQAMIIKLNANGHVRLIRHSGEITAYSILHRFGFGHVIGPVVASNREDAQHLISSWISDYGSSFLRLDIPQTAGLSGWLASVGLPESGGGKLMCTHAENPNSDNGLKVYALASQALK